jgi:hypothetical protein
MIPFDNDIDIDIDIYAGAVSTNLARPRRGVDTPGKRFFLQNRGVRH